ncbi:GHKL domain-containing protein [Salinadaptatus halalkaliphilus]|uniref:histidine kinase n=1 Tax=Salinadaptatus halalkaliphilus TaxID=2419781 RepID=A0A4S3TJD1_9EURY|nr:ATP-binding protein [Salinadaptatus halalkaliphilus]THE64224.1 GHKL domain-containing protein [Salinadaptatus halalkaliphilus]
MGTGARLIETIGERRLIVAIGVVFLVAAAIRGYVRIASGTAPTSALFVSVFISIPALILLYGGYRLREMDIHPDFHSTVATWTTGGVLAMVGFLAVYNVVVEGGISNPDRAFTILPAFSALAGFALGLRDAQIKTSKREIDTTVEQLRMSNERLEQFAYAASHDLQEPLRMVSSYLQLLERRADDELTDETREFLAYAVDGADRMRAMVDGLLVYSRIDTEGKPFETVALEDVVERAVDDLGVLIEECDAEITVGDLPQVEGDEMQLHRLVQNLLQNALEYTDDDPRVRVTAERNGDTWILSVQDNGIGIDPANQDDIFEVFKRLHTREEYPGTGIGLALCQRIAERHGGEIWVDSEPGKGSTFSVSLPVERASQPSPKRRGGPSVSSRR